MARRSALLSLAVICAAASQAGGSGVTGAAARAPAWHVTPSPFRLDVLAAGKPVTSVGGAAAPLGYQTTAGAVHHVTRLLRTSARGGAQAYVVATDEPGRTATVTVSGDGPNVRIAYAVSHPATVATLGFDLSASPRDHFLGTGERTRWVDMRRTVVPLKVRNACVSNSPSPFFVSSAGFGAWSSTTAVGRIGFPGAVDDSNFACDLGGSPCPVGLPSAAVRLCFKAAQMSLEVTAGSIPTVLSRHAESVGLPRAPWLPQLALIKWRDRIAGPAELFDDIAQMRSRGLPLGWILLDNPWETGASRSSCYGALTFDPAVYPNPKAMIAAIHAKGVRFMLWISPQIYRPSCRAPSYPDGWLTGNDEIYVRDLTKAAVRTDFTRLLDRLVGLGVDGFKGDRGDEVDLEPDTLAGGPGVQYQDLYPLLYAKAAVAALRSAHGSHFATLFRAFVPGSSSVLPGVVGPDAQQTFDGLIGEIRAGQTSGIAGAPVWGSDVGGYSGGTLTPEVFVRWAQFSALTPIFEVGGDGPNSTFWQFGAATVERFRAAATLHYELVPYLYQLALEASHDGLPVVRPLGMTWPGDAKAWAGDLEFTVGGALLAAPVTAPGGADGRVSTRVYLPAGRWIDLFDGTQVAGPATITRVSTQDDFPLYARRGTALPYNFRSPALWPAAWRPDDLLRAGRQGWLVAPGASGTAVAHDRTSTLSAVTGSNGTIAVTVTHALAEEQLLVLPQSVVCGVRSGSAALPRLSATALAAARGGWAPDPTRRNGVVVKVGQAPATLALRLMPC